MKGKATKLCLIAFMTACSSVAEVPAPDLAEVVARDGVPFTTSSVPAEIVDRLAVNRVVILGETHFRREHRELVVALVEALHARGLRQILLEWPQMADWLLMDFVLDQQPGTGWQPPTSLGGDMITAIRDLNRTLPADDRIRVHGIDVNLQDYGGAKDFLGLMGSLSRQLGDPGPLAAFLARDYGSAEAQNSSIERLRRDLESGRSELTAKWGAYWYSTVAEMVEVEVASISIRDLRADHYDLSVRLRENVMKRLADLRINGQPYPTLINVGANHAQKKRFRGTDQEWLGDYVAHRSPVVNGSAIVVAVTPARTVGPSGEVMDDLLDASPANELWRVMHETWPERNVFLPLDDAMFHDGGIPVNFEDFIEVIAPGRHYDVFLVLPLAHFVR